MDRFHALCVCVCVCVSVVRRSDGVCERESVCVCVCLCLCAHLGSRAHTANTGILWPVLVMYKLDFHKAVNHGTCSFFPLLVELEGLVSPR